MATPTRKVIPFMGGSNTKADAGMVGINQLVRSQGIEYLVGDNQIIHKIPGRSVFGTVGSVGRVQGLALATYDDGATFLLAVGSQKLWYADASNGFTGTFTAPTLPDGDRNVATAKMSAAHFNNRWFVVTGEDRNVVIESDATVITHGMFPSDQGKQTATRIAPGAFGVQPDGANGGNVTATTDGAVGWIGIDTFLGGEFDQGNGVYAVASMLDIGTSNRNATAEWEWTASNTLTASFVQIMHWMGTQYDDPQLGGTGDNPDGFVAWIGTLQIQISYNAGSSYSTVSNRFMGNGPGNVKMDSVEQMQVPIPDGTNQDQIRIKCVAGIGSSSAQAQSVEYRVYDVRVSEGFGATTYTTDAGNAMYYAFTEFDEVRGWESVLSDTAKCDAGAFGSVRMTLPTSAVSDNATHYRIWRTSNNNERYVKSEMGFVGKVAVGTAATFVDDFRIWDPDEQPTSPSYEWLTLDEFGEKAYWELNQPPPKLDFIGNFKGAMFGLANRTYLQSMAGRPNQWPTLFTIERMPFKEHSPLRCGYQVGDVLWIGAEAGIILLDHPIESQAGSLRLPAPRRMEGAPGCVGSYAATPVGYQGESLIAWVSNHGVYVSNLATFERVTDDIDWEGTVTESSLADAVLFWREKKQQLVLVYDKSGNGINDSYMLIHLGDKLKAPTGRPLITFDHPGDFSHWTGGRIGGVWKEFTGHASDDGVYLEEGSATADASQSYDGATDDIPVDVKTGRQYAAASVDVGRSQLYVTAPSTTLSLSVSYLTGRDGTGTDNQADFLLTVASTRGRWIDFNVNRSGDFMQWQFQTVGQVSFGLGPVAAMADLDDEQGLIE
jgi:hypothetical protein